MFYLIHLISRFRLTGLVAASVYAMLSVIYVPAQAQVAVGVNEALAAPIAPLGAIAVPDVNTLGILDRTGTNAAAWPQITNPGNQIRLQQFGKAAFWDMQVGGDGIQACASCHYHAGADNRKTNQMSPGLKRVQGGEDPSVTPAPDTNHEVLSGANQTLDAASYGNVDGSQATGDIVGFAVSEQALIDANGGDGVGDLPPFADDLNGLPGLAAGVGAVNAATDVDWNDVASSQGVRLHTHQQVTCFDTDSMPAALIDCNDPDADTSYRLDTATLGQSDPGFDTVFTDQASPFSTSRRVEPRNSPTALNAVYHLRNFWDGRADLFFNGVNPLGFRDPDARVLTFVDSDDAGVDPDEIAPEKLRIPFSSLASQAVGPIESSFEMVFDGRVHRELGKKLLYDGVVPLDGQMVAADDSLLGLNWVDNPLTPLRAASGRGLAIGYEEMIKTIFDQRFWGDGSGNHVCLAANGDLETGWSPGSGSPCSDINGFTLMEWNFSLFFGLGVQAYEATLTTEETIVDLLVGGVATGQVVNRQLRRNGSVRQENIVNVGPQPGSNIGLPLEGCILLAGQNMSAAAQAAAADLCMQHYAQFIHPLATAGSQAGLTGTPVDPGAAIGGCASPQAQTVAENGVVQTQFCGGEFGADTATRLASATNSLTAIDRGMGRFFAGATGCGICHFNPEFTGATVSALTGFGAAPVEVLPPGQAARIPPELPLERMVAFNGQQVVYDSGFYNIGVRPTPEDLSLGGIELEIPLAFSKLSELINFREAGGAVNPPYSQAAIDLIADELAIDLGTGLNELLIPTAPDNLTPRPFQLQVACGPGLVGNGNGRGEPNNNPNNGCVPTVIVGERLLRMGAFKAQDIRMSKATGPFMHNGSKMTVQQVINFYETSGHFPRLNLNNLDAGMRIFDLGVADTASLAEMIETGLTDWRVMHEEGKFDHPELCIPNGHDPVSGKTILAGIPAVGSGGSATPLATFEEIVTGLNFNNAAIDTGTHAHTLMDECTMPAYVVETSGDPDVSTVDEQPPAL